MREAVLITGLGGAAEDGGVEAPAARAMRRLLRRKGAAFGLFVIALLVALALLAPVISPYDPNLQTWSAVRKAPSALHWFGTDDVGRDVLARVIYGARASLLAGIISVAIALLVGVPIGIISGLCGGLRRCAVHPHHRCRSSVPISHSCHCARRLPGAEPRQCDDRNRHYDDANIHTADARPGDEGRGLCRGRACGRQPALANRARSYPAECPARVAGAGDALDRGRHHRRGVAVFSGPWSTASRAFVG